MDSLINRTCRPHRPSSAVVAYVKIFCVSDCLLHELLANLPISVQQHVVMSLDHIMELRVLYIHCYVVYHMDLKVGRG